MIQFFEGFYRTTQGKWCDSSWKWQWARTTASEITGFVCAEAAPRLQLWRGSHSRQRDATYWNVLFTIWEIYHVTKKTGKNYNCFTMWSAVSIRSKGWRSMVVLYYSQPHSHSTDENHFGANSCFSQMIPKIFLIFRQFEPINKGNSYKKCVQYCGVGNMGNFTLSFKFKNSLATVVLWTSSNIMFFDYKMCQHVYVRPPKVVNDTKIRVNGQCNSFSSFYDLFISCLVLSTPPPQTGDPYLNPQVRWNVKTQNSQYWNKID